ncbi:RDD family protein [Plectonema cf. radiosum LEGE 06105]|uniref:non-specific serine/threonine protein kinase n=1 Tax=Plectonema cf. radiosum LEGE 06105 TaxID=945769 RepID=A0A8J7F373_9CYAN|nr:RDD family protein [Plectonema radiosum]MBE9214020.1 RDD family protein [Plectonema cf. radiosum LEGE 06105]
MSLCINPLCQKPINPDNTLFCFGCGSELLLEGRYRVIKELGGGGFGKTYEVIETRSNTNKVLKVLINNHPKAVELFQREAEVLKSLNHPGIPKVESDSYFAYFSRSSTEPLHCLVMEKIEGLDLWEYIKQREQRPIDQKLAIQWLTEIVNILQQVHSQNFFHRDIKPSNIMLRPNGRLSLIDFGSARQVTQTYIAKQVQGQITGIMSAGYSPSEQMHGQAIQQSDFFALGRTFVFLLTGREPGDFYNAQTGELIWQESTIDVKPEFASLLDQMMEHLPNKRPKNTQEILDKIAELNNYKPVNQSQAKIASTIITTNYGVITNSHHYVSFIKRFYAYQIDLIFLLITSSFIGGFLSSILSFNSDLIGESIAAGWFGASGWIPGGLFLFVPDMSVIAKISLVINLIFNWLYFTVLESSQLKATLGKLLLGIKVADLNNQKISFIQANLRYWSKLISILILMIGFMTIMFTPKKQGVHDMLAKTIVIKK